MIMSNRFRKITSFIAGLLMIVGVTLIILLSFYWNFGLQIFLIKSIPTPDIGIKRILVDPMFLAAVIASVLFYTGYRLFSRKPKSTRMMGIETERELIVKFLISIALGMAGLWFIYNEYLNVKIWAYVIEHYVSISTGSQALLICAVISLLLLLIWFLVIDIRIRRKEESVVSKT
jgi:hypothetical protein